MSGLTEYARLLAEGLAKRQHEVTVVAVKHDSSLPTSQSLGGVQIQRSYVVTYLGRAPVSPSYAFLVRKLSEGVDLVNIHLPLADALWLGPLLKSVPTVVTYHCDVAKGAGLLQGLQAAGIDLASKSCVTRAEAIVTSTRDYAKFSRVLAERADQVIAIPPVGKEPLDVEPLELTGRPVIGFCGRIVPEKGLIFLLRAMQVVRERFPGAVLQVAGDWEEVAGGPDADALTEMGRSGEGVSLLGRLSERDLWRFYKALDVLVLPSVNSFEAFGMVQVEAMLAGTPVIASDLPGVREPILRTGMGIVVPPKDVAGLARAIERVVGDPGQFIKPADFVTSLFGPQVAIDSYESLFQGVIANDSADRE